jgi:acyl-coenzyme A synthetase/AMP-(fatty) acid ligase
MAKTPPDETAAVLFTSGSTGVPKGAVYSHGIFIAQVEILRSVYGIQPGEVDLASFPLFALFGPALGMAAVIPDMDPTRPAKADPAKIAQAIEDFGATNMFASPALLNVMGRWGAAKGAVLPSLKRVISAGAPARADSLERFIKLLAPGVQVFTPYGATESLPVSSIGTDEILGKTEDLTAQGKGVCVGKPVPGMEVAVIKISDEPLGEWSDNLRLGPREIGEIAVKGPVVTKEYFNRPESARLAKISDGEGGIWHRMGDVGYMDDEGRIWFCGRKSQRVQTAEGTLFTIPCEAVFNTHPDVYRTALTGVGPKGRQIPALCVELEPGVPRARHDAIRKELKALGAA